MPDNIINKKIARNTLMLYIRMFFTMVVGLYTSRVVLQTLGIFDYGIYSLVGGFVSMLGYLNGVFVSATQRYISFSLGKGNLDNLKEVYSTSLSIHIIISVFVLIVAETFGLWFINNQLVIASDRLVVANWVYHFSMITLLVSIIYVPSSACIIAHEHMQIYAYISIVEAVLKLVIVFLLVLSPLDKLLLYAFLLMVLNIIIMIFNIVYCNKKFKECRYNIHINKSILKSMFTYTGWTMIGELGVSFKDQTSNIILNRFFGTSINAARGIAMQVNGFVSSFATNVLMAMRPQIIKQYAAGNIQASQQLVYDCTRLSFYLLSIVSIPVIININYILRIWLGVVPEYTSQFLIISLIASLLYATSQPLTTAIQATGNIKLLQIGFSIIMLSELPFGWLLLKFGYSTYFATLPGILTTFLAIFFRIYVLKKLIPSYSYRYYIINVLCRCFGLFLLCFIVSYYFKTLLSVTFVSFVIVSFFALIITLFFIIFLGLSISERLFVFSYIKNKIIKTLCQSK